MMKISVLIGASHDEISGIKRNRLINCLSICPPNNKNPLHEDNYKEAI
jgi:hypothetical protein